jgi:hypothetical protein
MPFLIEDNGAAPFRQLSTDFLGENPRCQIPGTEALGREGGGEGRREGESLIAGRDMPASFLQRCGGLYGTGFEVDSEDIFSKE